MICNKICLVILNYNDFQTTCKLLDKIINYKSIDNIVVVDNFSTNESYERLLQYDCPRCAVIKTTRNGGYAFGNNEGIKYAISNFKPNIISIANPDVYFDESVIIEIKEIFANSDYALLSPIMYNIDGSVSISPYWNIPTYLNDLMMCFYFYRKYNSKHRREIDYSKKIMSVEVLPGSFLSFRTDALIDIDFFDQTLFLYCEERMIAWKLREKGYKTGLITDSKYDHMHAVTTRKYLKDYKINSLMLDARYYFEVTYNRIGLIKRSILKICMLFSKTEFFIIGILKSFPKNKRQKNAINNK